ncbi:MAG: hypothetical protein IT167_25750 [Bryobacterales bacterium]|nr:hypothetical protein [Bryobacterales bacterium]
MKKLTIILKLFPVILAAIKAVEEAIPLPGQGRKKLDLVLDVLRQAFDASKEISEAFSWDALVAVVVPMIARIVDLHNELGLFTKSAPSKA